MGHHHTTEDRHHAAGWIVVLLLMGHHHAMMDRIMPLDGLSSCRWVDCRRASPLWVDRGRGLLDFVVGSGVDEFAVGLCWLLMVWIGAHASTDKYISAIGDPGMKSPDVRVGLEAWNFCNEVGMEAPNMGSPRLADCADLCCPLIVDSLGRTTKCEVHHKVNESDNSLGAGDKFLVTRFKPYTDPDLFAVEKEKYLASLCEVHDSSDPWYFWMIMLKNGNFDKNTTLCPENGKNVGDQIESLTGGFYGTYDLDADLSKGVGNKSYFSVTWQKNLSTGSWVFSQRLTTSSKYPWLMLYLRADATEGFNGGYHYSGRGIIRKLLESPNFKVKVTLDVKQGGGPNSQFYLLDLGSCWKNNGDPCDGDVLTDLLESPNFKVNVTLDVKQGRGPNSQFYLLDIGSYWKNNGDPCDGDVLTNVTRYSKMIINPATTSYPGNANYLEERYDICDPYSNPQAQELVQILPHPKWAMHGYPEKQGDGWVGDSRTWVLDVGALSSQLYFYQDPRTELARRLWSSINVGTKIYVSSTGMIAEWSVSDFDILVLEDVASFGVSFD
nr:hypothetical protein CFP56_45241 [Quercus suber]